MAQPTTITVAMPSEASEVSTWEHYETVGNRSTYLGVNHSDVNQEILQLFRTTPKRSGESLGVRRCAIKSSRDYDVDNASGTGTLKQRARITLNIDKPIGVTYAQMVEQLRQLADLFATGISSTLDLEGLIDTGEI